MHTYYIIRTATNPLTYLHHIDRYNEQTITTYIDNAVKFNSPFTAKVINLKVGGEILLIQIKED
jgi:hypothetical protein